MAAVRAYLACYDIANPKRLRRVAKILEGYGIRIQESVFFCKLSDTMRAKLTQEIIPVINHDDDQVAFVDLGADPKVLDGFITIGRKIPVTPQIIVV